MKHQPQKCVKYAFISTAEDIKDTDDLEEKIKTMYSRHSHIRDRLKLIERRIKTLDEHIYQADFYKKHKNVNRIYQEYNSELETARKATGLFAKST